MTKIIRPHQARRILEAGSAPHSSKFIPDEESYRSFNFGNLETDSRAFRTAVGAMALLVASRDPRLEEIDTLVTVANSASRIGNPVAELLGLRHIEMVRDEEGDLYLPYEIDKKTKNVVILDGVFDKESDSSEAPSILGKVGLSVANVAVIVDRSGDLVPRMRHDERERYNVPVISLIRQPIPTQDARV